MSDFVMNEDQAPLERRADELRSELLKAEPELLADLTATSLRGESGGKFFEFPFWGNPVVLSCQDYIARDPESDKALVPIHQAMILYYFYSSKGSNTPGKWISFSELADGQFYNAAFQGYTSKKLLQYFQADYQDFEGKCLKLCGEKTSFGDGAFRFQILPRVAVLLVYWMGDDEFPPSYKILFEDIADYHLPTDACAILASMLTGKMISE
ncbi:MAG: DUF3786 domain-containing protein [Anaerolineales bacterium]|nr:DUF3786 domain-containing protein [Anaerolineales bacterium]